VNSKQAAQFQERFSVIAEGADLKTFMICAFIEETEDLQGMFFGSVADEDPQLSSILTQTMLKNLLSVLARYNGLGPHAAAGALKGMVDVVLDDLLDDMFQEQERGGPPNMGDA
jgi:hypothetical protein